MTALAELDLPFLEMERPEFGVDPLKHFAEARAKHPWLAASNYGYVVHEFTAIRDLFPQDDKLHPPYAAVVEMFGTKGTPWGRFTSEQMISLPPEEHKLLRHTFAAKFTPRFANQLRPAMRATIERLLDEHAGTGRMDFAEFASWYPISNMFDLVGADRARIAGIRDDLETLGLAFSLDKALIPALQTAIVQIDALVAETIEERRADPNGSEKQDLLTLLVDTADQGRINARQLTDLIMFFFIAGYDTTKNVLTYTMYELLKYPEIYARCAEDHAYCADVVEEALRVFNPGSVARVTSEEVTYRDVTFPPDTMLYFTFNISGRDPDAFVDAERFDPDREIDRDHRHVAFGLGKHMCLGQYIARAQLQEAIHAIARRMKQPRLDGEIVWRPYPGSWGLKTLPFAFEPVAG
ncbi:MAG: cytochrome P450 [Sphingomonadales bacterium]|nr:cytochrome P450 [Sphingomonadales bacterium]